MQKSYLDLEKKIDLEFNKKTLLKDVFIHRSYLNEHRKLHLPSNEKLEFLGDSVLSLITSIYLYKNFPDLKEGDYTDIKASIVRTESLAEVAQKLALGEYLYLSKGEEKGKGRINSNILADTFEALIAAIFIDRGFDSAYDFILKNLFKEKLDYIVKNKLYLSPKSRLQEIIQAKYKVLPSYQTIKETGPEHDKIFQVEVLVKDHKLGEGQGSSKKTAEEKAAENSLEKMT
ncbi:ribonuclease III [Candidatus Roizmanbacteria bacterium RIFCSPLOWO2_01_FULL_41_22]|uniref:Ribonuclease 3 n=2 Tax=Candidatus Roizmaniibacteriota TaxID=1752723 RepID=A0A1F7JQ51_9BACT|nr:MAG: ribonuclease III [Candidatus Roizmanbacteria bacterium RIFCSPLOWO2_01_FULL_41_22]OGK57725.1 MAG: ribonuclease III [Candidatus Roizmanbacteria bacterium RIFCSPLOWO2_02_FULL_41_9]